MTERHEFLRAGFVLPMSLVATFITMMIVAASATYCTTQFRTSGEYLNRTRCRLLAQSAIELVKLEIDKRREGLTTGIPDPANPNFHNAKLSGIANEVKSLARQETFLRQIPGYGPDFDVYIDIKADDDNGINNRIYATAVQKNGNRSTSVTLQENIKIPMSDANIFLYAYFANGDGHLTSQYLTVNGDVRSNKKFTLTGSEINGFIYSHEPPQINIKKKHSLFGGWLTWYDGKDVEIRNPKSYNSEYRGYPYKTANGIKTKYDVKARPTNPLVPDNDKTAWEGGFKGVSGETTTTTTKKKRTSIWDWIFGGGGGGTETTTTTTVESVMPIDEDLKTISGEHVVVTNVSTLYMPKIETDADLASYKSYAASAHNAAGGTGGSLVCSNCYRKADGSIAQLSATLMLPWVETVHHDAEYVHHDDEYEHHDAETEERAMTDRSRAAGFIPADGIPVYDFLTADEYKAKLARKEISADGWLQLKGEHSTDVPEKNIGSFANGYAGVIKGGTHDGTGLFFEKMRFDSVLSKLRNNKTFGSDFADKTDVKFTEDGWAETSATYSSNTTRSWGKKGQEVVKTVHLTLYGYRSGSKSGWTKFSDYRYCSGSTSGSCFTQKDFDAKAKTLTDLYSSKGITKDAIQNKIGWTLKNSGYYKESALFPGTSYGYLAISVVRNYEPNKDDVYTIAVAEVDSTREAAVSDSSQNVYYDETSWSYTGIYYSTTPAGYVSIDKLESSEEQTTISVDLSYESFSKPAKPKYDKLMETKLVRLYNFSKTSKTGYTSIDNWRNPFGDGYANTTAASGGFYNKIFKSDDLTTVANSFNTKYGIPKTDITGYFSSKSDGWYAPTSGYYQNSTTSGAGWLAIRVYAIIDGNSMDFQVEFEYLSDADAGDVETPTENLMEVKSIPLYDLQSGSRTPTGYTAIESAGGYLDTSTRKTYGGYYYELSNLEDVADYFDGKYGLSGLTIQSKLTGTGWSKRQSSTGWTGTKYYRSNNPNGYILVKVLWSRNSWSGAITYSFSYEYSSKPQESDPLDEILTYVGTPPANTIPVYNYISTAQYNALSDRVKKYWTEIERNEGYYSSSRATQLANGYFLEDDLEKVAAYHVTADKKKKLKTEDVIGAMEAEEQWTFGGTGYRSTQAMGYIAFDVDVTVEDVPVVNPKYEYLSVAGGEGAFKETVETKPAWDEKIKDAWDEKVRDPYDEDVFRDPTPVMRELRRVFVRGGYQIDSSHTGITTDDLLIKSGETLIGKTTADLRPFREDDKHHCNANTPEYNGKALDQGAVILIGTWDFPICIDGPVVFESDVIIRGFVSGRGTIYSGRNIHIIGDINYKNPPYWPDNGATEPDTKNRDLLVLISRGSIVFGNYVEDDLWTDASDGLLAGNYINGRSNSAEGLTRAYTATDYTRTETKYRKVAYNYSQKRLEMADVKYYESVVGDYLFMSKNNSSGTAPDEGDFGTGVGGSLGANGCTCRLSQHWDVNPNTSFSGYDMYASYQSSLIEAYVNNKGWDTNDRTGSTGKPFYGSIWNSSDFKSFCRNNYAATPTTYNYWSYDKPFVNCIQSVNAVLYSSMGIYGIVGSSKTPVVINGAIIGQDEALLPFTRNRRRSSRWGSKSEDLRLTLNWDIRLNKQSGDAVKNKDAGEMGTPQSSSEDSEATDIRILSWQEVPDDFNEEYHATP